MYDRAANPKGAAVVMNMEHCKKRRRSVDGIVGFECEAPLAADLAIPFCVDVDGRSSVSSPKICEKVWPALCRIRI